VLRDSVQQQTQFNSKLCDTANPATQPIRPDSELCDAGIELMTPGGTVDDRRKGRDLGKPFIIYFRERMSIVLFIE
jgi:hypothetical protein